AAQEAYVAADGEKEDEVYEAVEAAVEAEDLDAIKDATAKLVEATRQLEVVSSVLAAETEEEMRSIIDGTTAGNTTYRNLSTAMKNDVAKVALEALNDRLADDEDYSPS